MILFDFKVVPIPRDKIDEAKDAFREYGQLQNLEFADIPEEKDLQEVSPILLFLEMPVLFYIYNDTFDVFEEIFKQLICGTEF